MTREETLDLIKRQCGPHGKITWNFLGSRWHWVDCTNNSFWVHADGKILPASGNGGES